MADYSDKIDKAYASIKAKGGTIVFEEPPTDTEPADPTYPWEGNDEAPTPFDHVALLLPLDKGPAKAPESNQRVLIPAKFLPFTLKNGIEFIDTTGAKYSLTDVTVLAPDPAQMILFVCECTLWPAT